MPHLQHWCASQFLTAIQHYCRWTVPHLCLSRHIQRGTLPTTSGFIYNAAGDLLTLTDGKGQTTAWAYDAEGRVASKWDARGTHILAYLYDASGRLSSRWSLAKGNTLYNSNAVGSLTNIDYPSSTDLRFAYDALNRLTNMLDAAGTTRYIHTVLGNGQQTVTEDGPWTSDGVVVTNRYGRIAGICVAQPSGQYVIAYAYGANGNMVSRVYDANGPKTYYYTYDCQGWLRIKLDCVWNAQYYWWSLGSEPRYLCDGLLIVQERDSGNTPTVTYTRGCDLSGTVDGAGGIGGLLARSHGYSSGSWAYHNFYHADGNGNVTALVDSIGTLQASYIYDPYGRYLAQSGSLASGNAMRFSSKPWVSFLGSSATTGLYYYGYRFYDPYLQRWLNRDPVGELGGVNMYTTVFNCPLGWADRFGEGIWRISETDVDLSHPDVTVKAEAFALTEGFEVQYIPDPGECDCGEIVLFQTISSTGPAGQHVHVDANDPKPGQLPPKMTPQGKTPYSYVDSPGDGNPLTVWTYKCTAVAVCRRNGSDTLLSTYYFEFHNENRKIDSRKPDWRKHYEQAMKDWKKKGGKTPQ
ncbi:MAG: RHS repeat-associated core domain-containing protein [Verrucomicrobia bacterium]|nr:RHS repeat-associated core domain-containing protein [Verrucomicrobiota bacterium]